MKDVLCEGNIFDGADVADAVQDVEVLGGMV